MITTIQTNERTFIRTIVKWSKPAAILAAATVLLVAFVFVKIAHANSINQVHQALAESQRETSKIKSNLEEAKTLKEQLKEKVQLKDEKIQSLEQENSELKE